MQKIYESTLRENRERARAQHYTGYKTAEKERQRGLDDCAVRWNPEMNKLEPQGGTKIRHDYEGPEEGARRREHVREHSSSASSSSCSLDDGFNNSSSYEGLNVGNDCSLDDSNSIENASNPMQNDDELEDLQIEIENLTMEEKNKLRNVLRAHGYKEVVSMEGRELVWEELDRIKRLRELYTRCENQEAEEIRDNKEAQHLESGVADKEAQHLESGVGDKEPPHLESRDNGWYLSSISFPDSEGGTSEGAGTRVIPVRMYRNEGRDYMPAPPGLLKKFEDAGQTWPKGPDMLKPYVEVLSVMEMLSPNDQKVARELLANGVGSKIVPPTNLTVRVVPPNFVSPPTVVASTQPTQQRNFGSTPSVAPTPPTQQRNFVIPTASTNVNPTPAPTQQ